MIEPGAPKYFKIQKHTDVVHLKWDKPLEPNGVLIGYTLQYHTGEHILHIHMDTCMNMFRWQQMAWKSEVTDIIGYNILLILHVLLQ